MLHFCLSYQWGRRESIKPDGHSCHVKVGCNRSGIVYEQRNKGLFINVGKLAHSNERKKTHLHPHLTP